MTFLSFDEKAWDKVRPFAVKKTGVSEAIRAFEKAVPNKLEDLKTKAGCTEAAELLETVSEKLDGAKTRFDKKKHADEIKKVTGWISEIAVRKKAVTNYGDKLHKQCDDDIADANKAIDPFFEQAEDAKITAREIVSNMQDKAKEAMIAGAKGATDELLKCKEYAEKSKIGFDHLLSDSKSIYSKVVKAADAKLPKNDVLDEGQQKKRLTTVSRCNAIKYKVEDLDDLYNEFREAFELITFAGTKGDDLQEKFVKLIAADVTTCQQMAAEIGGGETAIDIDLKKVAELLEEAGKPQIEQTEKTRMVGEAVKWLKDGIGKLKRFEGQVSNLSKTLKSKVNNYPDFVSRDDEKFKRPLKDIDVLDAFIKDMETKSKPKFMKTAKSLGEKIVETQKK